MKSVMLSIRPEWCEKILDGQKTIEVRKSKPKLEVPFKVYIYCTKKKPFLSKVNGEPFYDRRSQLQAEDENFHTGNGKVIAEFVCDYVYTLESEFTDGNCFEQIVVKAKDDDGEEYTKQFATNEDFATAQDWLNWVTPFFDIRIEELRKYIGLGFQDFYGWHISNLKVYDKPKDITGFQKPIMPTGLQYEVNRISNAPQSWCYVEEL